jgi:hypothetical protein
VITSPAGLLDGCPPAKPRAWCRIIEKPQKGLSYATGIWLATQKVIRRDFDPAERTELDMLVLKAWRRDRRRPASTARTDAGHARPGGRLVVDGAGVGDYLLVISLCSDPPSIPVRLQCTGGEGPAWVSSPRDNHVRFTRVRRQRDIRPACVGGWTIDWANPHCAQLSGPASRSDHGASSSGRHPPERTSGHIESS